MSGINETKAWGMQADHVLDLGDFAYNSLWLCS